MEDHFIMLVRDSETFRFADLPSELCLMVLSHIIPKGTVSINESSGFRLPLAVAGIDRKHRKIALQEYYGKNAFEFKDTTIMVAFLEFVGPEAVSYMKNITVRCYDPKSSAKAFKLLEPAALSLDRLHFPARAVGRFPQLKDSAYPKGYARNGIAFVRRLFKDARVVLEHRDDINFLSFDPEMATYLILNPTWPSPYPYPVRMVPVNMKRSAIRAMKQLMRARHEHIRDDVDDAALVSFDETVSFD